MQFLKNLRDTESYAIYQALWAVRRWHYDQYYDGANYVDGHLLPIAEIVSVADPHLGQGYRVDNLLLAILHDAFEDGKWMPDRKVSPRQIEILFNGMLPGDRIAQLCRNITALTRKEGQPYEEDYIPNIRKQEPGVILVKACDLAFNFLNPGKPERKARYMWSLDYLRETEPHIVASALEAAREWLQRRESNNPVNPNDH